MTLTLWPLSVPFFFFFGRGLAFPGVNIFLHASPTRACFMVMFYSGG